VAWLEFTFPLGDLDRERVEALVEDCGALSVTYRDAGDAPVLEPAPGEVRLWPETLATALFDAAAEPALVELRLSQLRGAPWPGEWRRLDDRDWTRAWMDDFAPMRFGARLWIQPSGTEVAAAEAVIVALDPGLAFGTGTHPTTALCLEHLDAHPPVGRSVLDFGCGSGVLAIAALKLGARSAHGVDLDPQALQASADNAARNGVAAQLSLSLPEDAPSAARYDTVLANILSGPLVALAPALSAAVAPGGELVLSGILAPQVEEVVAAYAALDPSPAITLRDGWARIHLTARS